MLLVTNLLTTVYTFLLNIVIEYHVICTYLFITCLILLIFKKNNLILKKMLLLYVLFLIFLIIFFWTSINLNVYFIYLFLKNFIYLFFLFMVAFKLIYSFADKRQKKIVLILEKYKKRFEKFKFYQDWVKAGIHNIPVESWEFHKPFESLLLIGNYNNLKFYTTTANASNTLLIHLSNDSYYKFMSTMKINTHALLTPVDSTSYKTTSLNILTVFSCYFSNNYTITSTTLNTNQKYKSLSPYYSGFTWIEREIKEFSNIHIINLRDTRRLLTDYTTTINSSYNLTSYNNLTQDLYYNL